MQSEKLKDRLQSQFPLEQKNLIEISNRIFLCGSCFSENIGNKLSQLGWDTLVNPFGTLYNPLSVFQCIDNIRNQKEYTLQDLYFFNNEFCALDHHGSFRNKNEDLLIDTLNKSITASFNFLSTCDLAIITPGTAFTYYHLATNRHVANCHKIPGREFSKMMISHTELEKIYAGTTAILRAFNPAMKITFTVSPVKHLRDGIIENSVSKARLLSSLAAFLAGNSADGIDYFPAYEIMTEELRDYRFYASDLAHPSEWSINYIFEKFIESRMNDRANLYIKKYQDFLKMMGHRVMTTDSETQKKWIEKLQMERDSLKSEFPEMISLPQIPD